MLVLCIIMVSVRPIDHQYSFAPPLEFPSTVRLPPAVSTTLRVSKHVLGQQRRATPGERGNAILWA